MPNKVYLSGNMVTVDNGTVIEKINSGRLDYKIDNNNNFTLFDGIVKQSYALGLYSNNQNEAGTPYASKAAFVTALDSICNSSGNSGSTPGSSQDVNIQDQHTPSLIVKFNQVLNSTETVDAVAIGDTSVVLDDVSDVAVGRYLVFFNPTAVRFMTATVISIAATPTFEIDTPFDFAYPAGSFVDVANTNMNVDGSTTPVVFGLRGTGSPPGVELTADITRIIFSAITTSAVDLSKFANFAKLLRGVVLRKRDGTYENVLNVKSNRELAGIMYDWTPFAATNPQQGVDGFVARLTFGGQSKVGVVKRITLGEDLEIIIQDDLSTAQGGQTITELEIYAEGHIVED